MIVIIIMLKMFGKKIECKTIGDYHDLYLKSDVPILADISKILEKPVKNIII